MSGPAVHLHSPSTAVNAFPDRERSSCSSSLAIRGQEGVSGPRVVQAFIVTRYLPPGRRILTPIGPAVHLHSPSTAGKAYPDPELSSRSSSHAIRRQKGVSGPRVVQPFIFTRYPPPGRRFRIPSGPAVHLHSLSAARKAFPDPELSSRLSSLAIHRREGVSGPRVVQPFIFTRYPPPGRRIETPGGPAVHLHSLSATGKTYPDLERSSRSSSLAIHRRECVSGPLAVQLFIFTRYPSPGRRFRSASGPTVHLHSPCTAGKEFPDRERSSRPSSLAIRGQEGVSGPRVVQSFIFTRFPLPGRRVRTPGGPAVHLHSPSTAVNAFPDRERSSCSSSLAIRRQEGVSGPRVVQPFIFTRYPRPGRRIRSASGPVVYLRSLSAAGKACSDPGWSSCSSSLAIRRQEGVSGPRVVQPFIFTRHAPPGRSFRTVSGPAVYLHSLSAAGKALPGPSGPAVHLHSPCTAGKEFPDRERSSRLSSLAIRRREGASGPRVVQPFIFTRVPPPGRRIRTARDPAVHLLRYPPSGRRIRTARGQLSFLTRSSAVRMTRSDRGWSCRSRQLACLPPGSRILFTYAFSRSS